MGGFRTSEVVCMGASTFLKFPIQNREAERAGQRSRPTHVSAPHKRGRWVYEKAEKEVG
jgi:uncharacterized membrane protein YhiD involved in acid resistance